MDEVKADALRVSPHTPPETTIPEVAHVNYFLQWLSDRVMDERGAISPQGPTGKRGPHLKTQLHSAGDSHRYALFWLRSAAGLQ